MITIRNKWVLSGLCQRKLASLVTMARPPHPAAGRFQGPYLREGSGRGFPVWVRPPGCVSPRGGARGDELDFLGRGVGE